MLKYLCLIFFLIYILGCVKTEQNQTIELPQLKEGECRTPQDCEGLIHIMCVGSWSCENGKCVYNCDVVDSQ